MALLPHLSPSKMSISVINRIEFISIPNSRIKVFCSFFKLPLHKKYFATIQISQVLLLDAVEPALFMLFYVVSV